MDSQAVASQECQAFDSFLEALSLEVFAAQGACECSLVATC